jgi:integrase
MARRIPSYRHHKPTNQARVTLDGKDHWLGIYDTKASKDKYDAVVAEWLGTADVGVQDLTVAECCLHFWRFAKKKYGKSGKGRHGAAISWKPALRLLKQNHAKTPVSKFGPKALKRIVAEMVKLGWSHRYCIDQLNRAKQVFSYCAAEELIPHTVYERLRLVDSKAIEGARKTVPIEPVSDAVMQTTLAKCTATVAAMVQFERYTGCRPDEVCRLRPCDIQDKSGDVWVCQLQEHKTEHHGKKRFIAIGPKAQKVLLALGPRVPAMNYFVNQRGRPYVTDTYRRAIHRACDAAKIERWSPNRLRHSAATEVRAEFGLETASAILGHSNLATTQVYAEADRERMIEAARRLG